MSVERIKRWGLKGGLALLDQGVFSGSNFVLNILLARWLYPEDYGAYAIGFAISFFFLQFLMSYMLEPMGVLGPSSYGGSLEDYLAAQLRLYFVLMMPLGFLLSLVVYFYMQSGANPFVCNILITLGIVLPFLQLPWMLRRTFYVMGTPAVSAKGSLIYALSLALAVYVARHFDVLTGPSAVIVVALSGLLAGAFLARQLGWTAIARALVPIRNVFMENWAFGKWLLLSALLIPIGGQAHIFLSGGLLSIRDAGVVNAMQTLSQPMTLSITAINALVTPSLAADYAKADLVSFKKKAFSMTVILTLLASFFELFLFLFRIPLEAIVYGGKFSDHAGLIPIWGLTPLIMATVSGLQCSLQAAKRPYAMLLACLFWVPITLGLGTILTLHWGLLGSAVSTVIGYLVLAAILAFLYWQFVVRSSPLEKVQAGL